MTNLDKIHESLLGLAKVESILKSRNEIIIKAVPEIDLSWSESEIKNRIGLPNYDLDLISTKPKLVIRLRKTDNSNNGKIPPLNIILFLATIVTTVLTGALWEGVDWISNPSMILTDPFQVLMGGLPFSASLLGILLFHEFGHYFAARYHKVNVTLPYFIPAPPGITLIGTFGAFIKAKSAFINRKQLFDVGAAGPLAGMVIAIIVLILGINSSEVRIVTEELSGLYFGESLLFQFITYTLKGPIGENEVLMISSVGFAGWVGLFVTMINLLPISQLDGGHVIYAMFGKKQKYIAYFVLAGLLYLSFQWEVWGFWLLIGLLMKPAHPPTIADELPIGKARVWLGILCVVVFIITFIPKPIYFQ